MIDVDTGLPIFNEELARQIYDHASATLLILKLQRALKSQRDLNTRLHRRVQEDESLQIRFDMRGRTIARLASERDAAMSARQRWEDEYHRLLCEVTAEREIGFLNRVMRWIYG